MRHLNIVTSQLCILRLSRIDNNHNKSLKYSRIQLVKMAVVNNEIIGSSIDRGGVVNIIEVVYVKCNKRRNKFDLIYYGSCGILFDR